MEMRCFVELMERKSYFHFFPSLKEVEKEKKRKRNEAGGREKVQIL